MNYKCSERAFCSVYFLIYNKFSINEILKFILLLQLNIILCKIIVNVKISRELIGKHMPLFNNLPDH